MTLYVTNDIGYLKASATIVDLLYAFTLTVKDVNKQHHFRLYLLFLVVIELQRATNWLQLTNLQQ